MHYPTPIYNHVENYDSVYEPAEDSFLFLDSLQLEQEFIKCLKADIVVEIGCGSGVVTSFLSQILSSSTFFVCTDLNPKAALCCKETGSINNVDVNLVVTDLLTDFNLGSQEKVDSFLPRLKNKVDILLFNPPYVVTPSQEIKSIGLSSAWAGGCDGREVMDRLFPLVPFLLSPRGVFYLVVIKENKPEEITSIFEKLKFHSQILMQRKAGPERLSVMKFWQKEEWLVAFQGVTISHLDN